MNLTAIALQAQFSRGILKLTLYGISFCGARDETHFGSDGQVSQATLP
jgi:hypothetical protein